MMAWFVGTLILWTSFWDGWRDTGIHRVVDRRKWHIVKWLQFFPSQLFLTYLFWNLIDWYYTPILAGASWLIWQVGHHVSPWEPKT